MAACPNCAHPLDAAAACSACNQERPPASDALLTPGPAANKDRRRTLLALAPFLLLIATEVLWQVWLIATSSPLDWLAYWKPIVWLIALSAAVLTVWHARTEPPRARWGPKLERSARRRDRAWMFFAITVCNVGVAGAIYRGVLWGVSDGFWSSGLGDRVLNYLIPSQMLVFAGATVGLASVVWRLDVAARRRGRSPSRWLHRSAVAAFLSSAIIFVALVCVLLAPPAVVNALGAHPVIVFMDPAELISPVLAGLSLIGGLVSLGMLPAALRSPRQQPSAA